MIQTPTANILLIIVISSLKIFLLLFFYILSFLASQFKNWVLVLFFFMFQLRCVSNNYYLNLTGVDNHNRFLISFYEIDILYLLNKESECRFLGLPP